MTDQEKLAEYGLDGGEPLSIIDFPAVDSDEWLEQRRLGIGGSDVGAIMGLNKYKSPLKVYRQKVDGLKEDLSDNVNVRKGKDLEDFILKNYVQPKLSAQGLSVAKPDFMLTNARFPYYRANVDGIAKPLPGSVEVPLIVEIKYVSEFGMQAWDSPDYAGVPASYYAQVQCYMHVTGIKRALVCALFDKSWDMHYYEIEHDAAFCAKMDGVCGAFYGTNMCLGIPPKVNVVIDSAADIAAAVESSPTDPLAYTEDAAMTAYCEEYAKVNADIKTLEKRKGELASDILNMHSKGLKPSAPHKVSYTVYTTHKFNAARFKEADPSTYEQYCEDIKNTRTTVK